MNEERLINATWLKHQIEEYVQKVASLNDPKDRVFVEIMGSVCRMLDETPTVDTVRVVHGRWRLKTAVEDSKRLDFWRQFNTADKQIIRRYDEMNHTLIQLTGHNIKKLIELFAAGWILEPPNYSVDTLSEVFNEKNQT